MKVTSGSEQETAALAARLARVCAPGDCILLIGDLGAGKTSFARGFIRALSDVDEVASPTFTLAQTYPTRAGWPVVHFDFYRLEKEEELDQIGLEEALETGVALIEWPQIAAARLPQKALSVEIGYGKESTMRDIVFHGETSRWGEWA